MTDITVTETFRLSKVFSKTFGIFGRRFLPIIVLTAVAHIPNYLAQFLIGQPQPAAAPGRTLAVFGITGIIQMMVGALASGMVIYGVVQEMRGKRFSALGSFSVVLPRLLPVVGVGVCTGILTALGALLLLVPGIMLACMWFVSVPACVVERTGVFASMGRSRALTKGHRWPIFGAFALIVATILVFSVVVGAAVGAGMVAGVHASPEALALAVLIAQLAVVTILGAFSAVFSGVCYSELRAAKEGINIHAIASVFD
jgi:hypothetical protein